MYPYDSVTTTRADIDLRMFASEQGITFAIITLLLVGAGLVTGMTGAITMAGCTAFVAIVFFMATAIKRIADMTDEPAQHVETAERV